MTPARNVVDSSGWLEYLADGPNADFFAGPLAEPDALIVPTISVFEVFKRVLQQRDETTALQVAALMQQGKVVDLDLGLALLAGRLSVDLKLPMADAIILATARRFGAVLWTQDANFDGIPGIHYLGKTAR